ncbi:MAG: hypothetical protein JSR82_05810 [Verrucomicrobia bacterium]|nr:hypothetical protein [Verrucomicrobiota bacterium]
MNKQPRRSLGEILARLPLRDVTPTDAFFLEESLLSAMDRAEAGIYVIGDPTPHSRTELLHTLGCALQWRDGSIIALSLNEPHIQSACARAIWTREADGNFGRLDMLIRRVPRINPPSNVVIVDSILEPMAMQAALELAKSRLVVIGLSVTHAREVPRKLFGLGVDPGSIGEQLCGAFVQRVYQRPCPACALRTGAPWPYCDLGSTFAELAEGWWLARSPARPPHDKDDHCEECDRERSAGEIACYEMFDWNADLRQYLRRGDLVLLEQAIRSDMSRRRLEEIPDRAIRYARRGLVYVEDVRIW